jgi:hypothetical protein
MNKKILIGSIIAVVILILVSFTGVVGKDIEKSTILQELSNKGWERYYIVFAKVSGLVDNVRWIYAEGVGYMLCLRAVNLRVNGIFMNPSGGHYKLNLTLKENQDFDLNNIMYFGLNWLRINTIPFTVKFLFGLLFGGTITNQHSG